MFLIFLQRTNFSKIPQKISKNILKCLQKSSKITQKSNSPFPSMSAATLLGPNLVSRHFRCSCHSASALGLSLGASSGVILLPVNFVLKVWESGSSVRVRELLYTLSHSEEIAEFQPKMPFLTNRSISQIYD